MSIGELLSRVASLRASITDSNPTALILTGFALATAYILIKVYSTLSAPIAPRTATRDQKTMSVMSAPRTDLAPPKDDPFTLEQLKRYDGKTEGTPIYVAIKGTVFDVSNKKEMYGPGASYNLFAGKDGSRGLGLSSLKPEDAVPDWSTLGEAEKKVLDQWHGFFSQRYNVVGKVTDLPAAVAGRP